jgi:hypothetical protein
MDYLFNRGGRGCKEKSSKSWINRSIFGDTVSIKMKTKQEKTGAANKYNKIFTPFSHHLRQESGDVSFSSNTTPTPSSFLLSSVPDPGLNYAHRPLTCCTKPRLATLTPSTAKPPPLHEPFEFRIPTHTNR